MKKMFKKVGTVVVIMGVGIAFGFLKNILLARELNKEDFGLFNLIMTIAGLIYPLALFGQQNTIVRVFSKRRPEDYNWKSYFHKLLLGASIAALIGGIASTYFYKLTALNFIFLLVVIGNSMIADLYTYIFRATGQYETSIILHRSIRVAFPIILLLLILLDKSELNTILYFFGALHLIHSFAVMLYTNKRVGLGTKKLTKNDYKEGLILICSDITMLVIISVDKLFLAKLTNLERVAEYFAIFSLMRIFEIVQHAIDFVLIPHSNKVVEVNVKGIFFKVLGIGLVISLFYLILAKPIIHFLYSGKYDSGIQLVPYFCLVGLLQLLYVVPASIIRGRLEQKALKTLTAYDLTLLFASILLTYVFITLWDIIGALIATSLIWLMRLCLTYLVLLKYYQPIGPERSSYSLGQIY